ncbi:uncharacterized protein TNCV_867591 [Trichonephila clavipes]|nr:uncharacterized protein TNCV_867591 [Trichonephila clavipes]
MTSARGHGVIVYCLNSGGTTSRLAAIMVKESRHPSDNRRSLSSKNRVVISDMLREWDNRNRWRDGQVCPDVGQGIMAPWDRLGDERTREMSPALEGKKERALAGDNLMRALRRLKKQLRSKFISGKTKLRLYKTLILPVLLYASETWTLNLETIRALETFERKALRTIFGPVKDQGCWRTRYNFELYRLYKEPQVTQVIRSNRLRWLGHIWRKP